MLFVCNHKVALSPANTPPNFLLIKSTEIEYICFEVNAYCAWAGRRLPTEAEWELTASAEPNSKGFTSTKRMYPWGDEFPSPDKANLDSAALGPIDVRALPEGDSAFGCRQMIGNVWEWTADTFDAYPGFEIDPYETYSAPSFGQ